MCSTLYLNASTKLRSCNTYMANMMWTPCFSSNPCVSGVQAHSNASQYLPLLILFLALLEAAESTSAWLLHLWGKP